MRRVVLVLALVVLASALHAQPAVTRLTMESKVMGETRIFLVKTPESYATGDQRYPVLYMTDGAAQLGHTAATVDFLAREGRMPEAIVVGIGNTDRTRDLTPTHVDGTTLGGRFPTSGGADRFLSFIETELIPYVEANYRTRPYRVFAGHSFGGLFALHTLITRPRLFNGIIAVSPSLPWDDNYFNRRLPEFLKKNRELDISLFVTSGNEGQELDREMSRLWSLIRSSRTKGLEFGMMKFDDEDHGSVVLPSHHAALKHAFAGWQFAIAREDDPTKLFARASDHYARLSKRMGYTVAVPEQTVNFIGYRLMQENKIREAIEVLKTNADWYPGSPNVYDSLGEAYERNGSLDLARGSYERAWHLGKKNADPNAAIYEQNLDRVTKALENAKPTSRTNAIRSRALTTVAAEGNSGIEVHRTDVELRSDPGPRLPR